MVHWKASQEGAAPRFIQRKAARVLSAGGPCWANSQLTAHWKSAHSGHFTSYCSLDGHLGGHYEKGKVCALEIPDRISFLQIVVPLVTDEFSTEDVCAIQVRLVHK